jgi:hypothetical protein
VLYSKDGDDEGLELCFSVSKEVGIGVSGRTDGPVLCVIEGEDEKDIEGLELCALLGDNDGPSLGVPSKLQ